MLFADKNAKTRERLVAAAMELFYLNGYHATSVAEILSLADAGSGSLYYYFKDKEDLALAVADTYRKMLHGVLFAPVISETDDPIEAIFKVLDNYRQGLIVSDFVHGCPIGNLALEVGDTLPRVANRLMDNFEGWVEEVERLLLRARDRFPDDVDLHGLATLVLTTMEGGVMLSRTKKDIHPFDTAVAQLKDYFSRLIRK